MNNITNVIGRELMVTLYLTDFEREKLLKCWAVLKGIHETNNWDEYVDKTD